MASEKVDFVEPFNKLLDAIEGAINAQGLWTAISYVGIVILLATLVTWLFQKRRGGSVNGQDAKTFFWPLLIGGICVAPKGIIPILLKILGGAINIIIHGVESL
ncbi:hypothetical protein [Actinomyces vulturis]|uniref:hypothetical protein n=1 Tax=Actinomyces vulturis TaxID=1857645 RepID=UPI00114753AD|nr:hypothetical protein [Actinomyces vulturis]